LAENCRKHRVQRWLLAQVPQGLRVMQRHDAMPFQPLRVPVIGVAKIQRQKFPNGIDYRFAAATGHHGRHNGKAIAE
jgi:hypothetical protein